MKWDDIDCSKVTDMFYNWDELDWLVLEVYRIEIDQRKSDIFDLNITRVIVLHEDCQCHSLDRTKKVESCIRPRQ